MFAHNQLARPYARLLRPVAAAGVLLGLCCGSGCDDTPRQIAGRPIVSSYEKPDGAKTVKLKRTPRTPK
jgi:hypothetical protein